MTKESALQLMRTSKTVQEWNANRLTVQTKSTQAEWEGLHRFIDAYGLIVEVLGRDSSRAQIALEKDLEVVNN